MNRFSSEGIRRWQQALRCAGRRQLPLLGLAALQGELDHLGVHAGAAGAEWPDGNRWLVRGNLRQPSYPNDCALAADDGDAQRGRYGRAGGLLPGR